MTGRPLKLEDRMKNYLKRHYSGGKVTKKPPPLPTYRDLYPDGDHALKLLSDEGGVDPMALWQRTHMLMQSPDYPNALFRWDWDVSNDPSLPLYAPAIKSEGLELWEVNKAMVQVLTDHCPGKMGGLGSWLATHQNKEGWIYSLHLVEDYG